MPLWTNKEEQLLRELYPAQASRAHIERAIPRHNWAGIQQRALKLKIGRRRKAQLYEVSPIIAALVDKRKHLGISQEVAAKAIGIVPFTLSRYERGEMLPNLRHLQAWCDVVQMRISISDGFGGAA